jgi:hypothetical protein
MQAKLGVGASDTSDAGSNVRRIVARQLTDSARPPTLAGIT